MIETWLSWFLIGIFVEENLALLFEMDRVLFTRFLSNLVTYLLCYVFIHISHFVIDLHSIDEIIICIIVTEQLLSSLKTGTC